MKRKQVDLAFIVMLCAIFMFVPNQAGKAVVAEDRSVDTPAIDEPPIVKDGSIIITIIKQPSGDVECPDSFNIKGTVDGSILNETDFLLVLDSSGSLTWTDPDDFRLQGSNALADAMTEDDRLAVVDFDAPEDYCGSGCNESGTEVEACFLNPVTQTAIIDTVLTIGNIDQNGMTSFYGAARELVNAYEKCPDPFSTYGGELVYCPGGGSYTLNDTDRIGSRMYVGTGPEWPCN